MIEIRGIAKSFPHSARKRRNSGEVDPRQDGKLFHAVRDITLTAHEGAILGLLGPNGAGKTTLLRMLSTALRPTAGTVLFDGVDIVERPLEVRRKIGFLSGDTGLYARLTAREMIRYFGRLHGMARGDLERRLDQVFALLDMSDFADRRNGNLSSGMAQKVSIARTLIHDPQVLILDEPTTGLDVEAAQTILECVKTFRSAGKTVLFSTHHMHEVDFLCDRVAILARGRLCFDGSVDEMRAHSPQGRLDQAFLALVGDAGKETPTNGT